MCSLLASRLFVCWLVMLLLFAGALCVGVTSESVYKLREMVVKEVFQALVFDCYILAY